MSETGTTPSSTGGSHLKRPVLLDAVIVKLDETCE